MIVSPPPEYGQDFHTKAFVWKGIYVLANDDVPDEALLRAAEIVFNATAQDPALIDNLAQNGVRFAIIPEGTDITELPDYEDLPEVFPGTDWDQYRGLGATTAFPTSSAGEENILAYPSDPYLGEESIALHEWLHGVEGIALAQLDPAMHDAYQAAYQNALDNGLWQDTYADDTFYEYFAETAQAYFDDNPERGSPDGIHNQVNTRAELAIYDPTVFALHEELFGATTWRVGDYFGGETDESLVGTDGDDLIFGNGGSDDLSGGAGDDYLIGGSGGDLLDGGGGDDRLDGGAGDDVFVVDSAGDMVAEAAGEGSDRVKAAASHALAEGVHVELLTTTLGSGTDAIDLAGNALAQEIIGNYGQNTLTDGPTGGAADHLRGLSGDDVYRVYNSGTTIVESSAQGAADRVIAAVDYQLGAGVHVEMLTTNAGGGTSPINLTGNALAQEIIGNYGDNILHDGGKGAGDHLRGLSGNDTYRVFNTDTTIVESAAQGNLDTVISGYDYVLGAGVHVEVLQTNAGMSTRNLALTGNELGQEITGNNGDNRLEGQGGNDTLRGLGGNDSFVFADALGPDNVDTILDFDPLDDRFLMSNDIFSGFGERTGEILPGHLRVNTTGEAQDASDMIIYDSDDGFLYYDADGFGAGDRVHFATIDADLAITNSDFVLA